MRTIMVTTVEENGMLVLLDKDGQPFASCKPSLLGLESADVASHIDLYQQWRDRIARFIGSQMRTAKRLEMTPWDRKIEVWLLSARQRLFTDARPRKRQHDPRSTTTWEECLVRFYRQHEAARRRTQPTAIGQWKQWADTVAKNHNRRRDAHAAEAARANAEAGVSVCVDRRDVDSADVGP